MKRRIAYAGLRMLLCALCLLPAVAFGAKAVDIADPEQALELLSRPGITVLDVRTRREYAAGHLPGAVNIPLASDDFAEQVGKLWIERPGPWMVYCRTGSRSTKALPILLRAGVRPLYHFSGGIVSWPYELETP